MDGPPGMFGMPRMMGPGMMGPGMMGPGMMMGQGMGGDFPPFQASPAFHSARLYCKARPRLLLMMELKSAPEDGDSWQAKGPTYSQDELPGAISDCFNPSYAITTCLLQGMEGPGMDGPAWKRQRMEDGPGGPSRQDSVFYKTRMCHKCAFLPCWQRPSGPL